MTSIKPHNDKLFNSSGCLSPLGIEHFLKGTLSDADRQKLREHLDSCMLCREALEGYELSGGDVDIATTASGINRRLRERFQYTPEGEGGQGRMPALRQFVIPAAASLLVLFGLIAYFHFLFPEGQELAMLETSRPDEGLIAEPMAGKGITGKGTIIDSVMAMDDGRAGTTAEVPSSSSMVGGVAAPGGTGRDLSPDNDKEEAVITAQHDIDVLAEEEAVEAAAEETVIAGVALAEQRESIGVADEAPEPAMAVRSMEKSARQSEMTFMDGSTVTTQPSFPGGADSLQAFLSRHIRYALSADTASPVFVKLSFTVSRKGKISNIAILRSGGDDRDRELIESIEAMPQWLPATLDGKPVSAEYVLRVHFMDP